MHLIKVKAAGTLLLCFALFAAGCGKDKNGVIPSQGNGINESDMADKPVDGKTIKDRENSDISTDVFISQLAGSWYPDDKSLLDKMLSDFLQQVPERKNEKFQALILPHAGYRYSGKTAAYGVKNLDTKQIKRVVIIGPSHHAVLKNRISVLSADYVSTPLGKVEVDTEAVKALLKSPFVISSRKIHEREHSVQMEIPLFQKTLDNFKIISVVAGDLDSDSLEKIALLLKQLGGPSTLFAASSDFIHFGKRFGYTPFVSDAEAGVKKINFEAADFIKKMDAAGFLNYVQKTGATICGRIPIALLLKILPQKTSGTVLHYSTSIKKTEGDNDFVSYMAMGFKTEWRKQAMNHLTDIDGFVLDGTDKQNLLLLARRTLEFYLKNRKIPDTRETGVVITSNMKQIMGAFVTLKKQGNLRGCIGEIFPRRELYKAVMDHAVNAAVHDSRFMPVKESEFKDLEFEISALTKPVSIPSYSEFIVGTHGIVLSKEGRSAVFLPQVAPEQGWDTAATLTHLSIKAGLSADAWKEGTEFSVFTAIVFSGDDL